MRFLTRPRWWRRVVRRTGRALFDFAENNSRANVNRNGERWFLHALLYGHVARRSGRPFVVIDAGANIGDYTRAVLREAAKSKSDVVVHAFEPSPRCARTLREEFSGDRRVQVVEAAVAEQAGRAPLFAGDSGSTQASLLSRDILVGATSTDVALLRLEDYLRDMGLDRIDLLKLDVEGSELAALEGLGSALNVDCVRAIQLEYGGTTLDSGTSLREIYACLADRGYAVAKLFPRFLEIRAYQPWMEHYTYANYVALSPGWFDLQGWPLGRGAQ
jgi:FkbM family methyltransferase